MHFLSRVRSTKTGRSFSPARTLGAAVRSFEPSFAAGRALVRSFAGAAHSLAGDISIAGSRPSPSVVAKINAPVVAKFAQVTIRARGRHMPLQLFCTRMQLCHCPVAAPPTGRPSVLDTAATRLWDAAGRTVSDEAAGSTIWRCGAAPADAGTGQSRCWNRQREKLEPGMENVATVDGVAAVSPPICWNRRTKKLQPGGGEATTYKNTRARLQLSAWPVEALPSAVHGPSLSERVGGRREAGRGGPSHGVA